MDVRTGSTFAAAPLRSQLPLSCAASVSCQVECASLGIPLLSRISKLQHLVLDQGQDFLVLCGALGLLLDHDLR